MNNFATSLVEVEILLNQLEPKYKNKIPSSFWKYIQENKDKNYKFTINFNKPLEKQNLLPDTIAILTYINIEYLLNERQKNFFKQLLLEDEKIAESKKKEKYSTDIFNKKI